MTWDLGYPSCGTHRFVEGSSCVAQLWPPHTSVRSGPPRNVTLNGPARFSNHKTQLLFSLTWHYFSSCRRRQGWCAHLSRALAGLGLGERI
ncbi:hypothetical protein BaRGS_00010456 [Batillaria attramentaria]|uniref:Uncharacterized protein n=1 Tax=Batillaria attramentaria TaxID=370345 RepID=A0ABD0LG67_9CAEN